MRTRHQVLPASGPEREALRKKGQFWTPSWVAEAMVEYALGGGSPTLFDPAVGAGAFFLAAKRVSSNEHRSVRCMGAEIDPLALEEAGANGLNTDELAGVSITDFVIAPPVSSVRAIVANPPYIRHHRLSSAAKVSLKRLALDVTGRYIDGRAGLHVYFLIRALQLLEPEGRLAFIIPADTCEGVFAATLWSWIASNYKVDGVITFASDATPFPGVDTNPLIVMIRRAKPTAQIVWARCHIPETDTLTQWVRSGLLPCSTSEISASNRSIGEALATGLSRPPNVAPTSGLVLGDFVRVMRGIATGANEYFCLTRDQAMSLGIPSEFLRLCVARTRDVPGEELTDHTLSGLERDGRPIFLFAPDGRDIAAFPPAVRRYVEYGKSLQLAERALIAQRQPWYRMERRKTPPLLFAYLGRRNARFILNSTTAVPLTGFLCVYPKEGVPVDRLWQVLRDPQTIANLALVGKSYGGGAIKVEPRGLERLPLPIHALEAADLHAPVLRPTPDQLAMPM